MWLLIRLSETYTVTYNLAVSFTDIPSEIWIQEENRTHNLRIAVNATGFRHLKASFVTRQYKNGFPVPLNEIPWRKQNQQNFYINTANLIYLLSESLGLTENELKIVEQEIFFTAESTVQKQVEIRFSSKLQFKQGFGQYGKIRVEPETAWVYGPATWVDTLQFLPVFANPGADIHTNVSGIAWVNQPANQLKTSIESVNYFIEVQQFTEKSFNVPIQKPMRPVLKLFPDKVTVSLRLALKDFEFFSADSIQLVLDTTGLHQNRQFLRLNALLKSEAAELIQIAPNQVEYLILKQ